MTYFRRLMKVLFTDFSVIALAFPIRPKQSAVIMQHHGALT